MVLISIFLRFLKVNLNKEEIGKEAYLDFDLIICQESDRPIMTEHLNKKFQKVLNEVGIKAKNGEDQ